MAVIVSFSCFSRVSNHPSLSGGAHAANNAGRCPPPASSGAVLILEDPKDPVSKWHVTHTHTQTSHVARAYCGLSHNQPLR